MHFNVPQHVPLTGSISYNDLAQKTGVPVSHLQRAIHVAIANGMFREEKGYQIHHNELSANLCTDADFVSTLKWLVESNEPIAQRFVEMTEKWKGSESNIHTAHNLANSTELPFYAYQSQRPDVVAKMAGAMRFVGSSGTQHIRHLVQGYDWAGLGKATVVDVSLR